MTTIITGKIPTLSTLYLSIAASKFNPSKIITKDHNEIVAQYCKERHVEYRNYIIGDVQKRKYGRYADRKRGKLMVGIADNMICFSDGNNFDNMVGSMILLDKFIHFAEIIT